MDELRASARGLLSLLRHARVERTQKHIRPKRPLSAYKKTLIIVPDSASFREIGSPEKCR